MARLKFEPYIERASPQSLDVKLWRTYRCDSDSWRLLAEQSSRPNPNGVRLPRFGVPNLAMTMRSRYNIGIARKWFSHKGTRYFIPSRIQAVANRETRSVERWANRLIILLEPSSSFVITDNRKGFPTHFRGSRPRARPPELKRSRFGYL